MISLRGQGWLRAANPTSSATPSIKIAGSCELPLVFHPEGRVRKVVVRVVQDLPYGLIIGTAFSRMNGSVIRFAAGGSFKPAPESPWVPFISSTGVFPSRREGSGAAGWRAARQSSNTEVKAAAITNGETWDNVCAVKPPGDQEEPDEII